MLRRLWFALFIPALICIVLGMVLFPYAQSHWGEWSGSLIQIGSLKKSEYNLNFQDVELNKDGSFVGKGISFLYSYCSLFAEKSFGENGELTIPSAKVRLHSFHSSNPSNSYSFLEKLLRSCPSFQYHDIFCEQLKVQWDSSFCFGGSEYPFTQNHIVLFNDRVSFEGYLKEPFRKPPLKVQCDFLSQYLDLFLDTNLHHSFFRYHFKTRFLKGFHQYRSLKESLQISLSSDYVYQLHLDTHSSVEDIFESWLFLYLFPEAPSQWISKLFGSIHISTEAISKKLRYQDFKVKSCFVESPKFSVDSWIVHSLSLALTCFSEKLYFDWVRAFLFGMPIRVSGCLSADDYQYQCFFHTAHTYQVLQFMKFIGIPVPSGGAMTLSGSLECEGKGQSFRSGVIQFKFVPTTRFSPRMQVTLPHLLEPFTQDTFVVTMTFKDYGSCIQVPFFEISSTDLTLSGKALIHSDQFVLIELNADEYLDRRYYVWDFKNQVFWDFSEKPDYREDIFIN